MEIDHLVPKAEGGTGDITNAIPLCFDCHAEVHAYNDRHPRGRKFQPEELRLHKKQWLDFCSTNPSLLVSAPVNPDAGPLQALIDELEFNMVLSEATRVDEVGARLVDAQFLRAVSLGAISILDDVTKQAIYGAYHVVSRVNGLLERERNCKSPEIERNRVVTLLKTTPNPIKLAHDRLLSFVGTPRL